MEGDELELSQLFNAAYQNYAGFVPRSPDYWRWSCLNRPNVDRKGILVVLCGAKTVGYAVVGKKGNIWELCYNPEYDGKIILSTILTWSLNYIQDIGGEIALFNAPTKDRLFREVCSEFGFVEKPPPHIFLNILDFPEFISELLNLNCRKLESIDEEFSINVTGSPSFYEKKINVKIKNGTFSVNSKNNCDSRVTVEGDVRLIVSCLLGTQGILRAIFFQKIKVKPFWKCYSISKLFSLIKINDPWFSPGSDYG